MGRLKAKPNLVLKSLVRFNVTYNLDLGNIGQHQNNVVNKLTIKKLKNEFPAKNIIII